MDISSVALSGLQQAQTSFDGAASRVATAGQTTVSGETVDTRADIDVVDFSTAAVSMLSAKNDVSIGIAVLKKANEIQRQALDLFA
jgi:hypothetical protein